MSTPFDPTEDQFPYEADEFPEIGPDALASIPLRALARIIDTMLLVVVTVLAVSSLGSIDVGDETVNIDAPWWLPFAILALAAVYEIGLTVSRGQTIGKMVVGIRVAQRGVGANPTPNQAMVRWLVPNIAGVIPIAEIAAIAVLGVYLSAAASPVRQGLHDRLATTVVVRTR